MTGYRKTLACAVLLSVLTGCVDDKYDLSDIDTTVKINVDNLTIPVNIDEITLGSIIKPDKDRIKIIDGKYAIVYDGQFSSDGVKINAINLKAPTINPSETVINMLPAATQRATLTDFTFQLANEHTEFQFSSNSAVSDFIMDIDKIGATLRLDIAISMRGLENLIQRVTFRDVVLQIPRGLNLTDAEGGSYNPATGELTLPATRTINGTVLRLSLTADAVNFKQAGGTFDSTNRIITVPGTFFIKSGTATVAAADLTQGTSTLPQQVTLRTEYTLYDTTITGFSGTISQYSIDGTTLTAIDLSELPDLLKQQSTDITLANPMVFLQVNNPLQPYGDIYAETALKVTAHRNNSIYDYSSDVFAIGNPAVADGIYNLCLSPATPIADAEYPDAQHVGFASFGSVLSGNGMPASLSVSLENPSLPAGQTVTDFPLTGPQNSIGSFRGKYKFVAPLQFSQGSTVVYSDKIDGWYNEDMDHLTITGLDVALTVSTDIPVGVEFTGYPIDANGQKINNVEITGATIAPNADKQKVNIRITGAITGLNGISFEAKAKATSDAQALSPDMKITISEVRPKASGYYEDEL